MSPNQIDTVIDACEVAAQHLLRRRRWKSHGYWRLNPGLKPHIILSGEDVPYGYRSDFEYHGGPESDECNHQINLFLNEHLPGFDNGDYESLCPLLIKKCFEDYRREKS